MTRSNLHADMVGWLVPYQANTRIVESTAERIGLPMDRVMMVIQNTAPRPPRRSRSACGECGAATR